MLELMHFPEELLDASGFKPPIEKAVGKAEMQMAKQLIQSMTSKRWLDMAYTNRQKGGSAKNGIKTSLLFQAIKEFQKPDDHSG